MIERPILFSGAMVRAILAGRKTQTRRVVKPQPLVGDGGCWFPDPPQKPTSRARHYANEAHMRRGLPLDFQFYGAPGDRLWVRETWAPLGENDPSGKRVVYAAGPFLWGNSDPKCGVTWPPPPNSCDAVRVARWRPSIYMPRWASRLTLEVMGVRVERLNDISEEDAKAEGADRDFTPCDPDDREDPREVGYPSASDTAHAEATKHRRFFRSLWESINGPDSWAANPWVWVVDFRRVTP